MHLILLPSYEASAPPAALTRLRRSQGIMELAAHIHHGLPPAERIRLLHARIPGEAEFHRLIFSDVHAAWEQIEECIVAT